MPARAWPAMGFARLPHREDAPEEQGASAVKLIATWRAVAPSA